MKAANAWSNFAYLEGEIVSSASTLDDTGMTFEYQTSGASSWTTLSPVKEGDLFKATLKGLTPNTTYSYRLKYSDGTEEYISDAVSFTTEVATALVNGNMDDWYQSGKHGMLHLKVISRKMEALSGIQAIQEQQQGPVPW